MPQNKIGNIGRSYFSKTERSFSEALEEKLADEILVIDDRVGDEPALGMQMPFVLGQNVCQG